MGFGFPAAIGAAAGRPDALVIDIAGDGSYQMNLQELATAKLNGFNVKVVILNTGYLGMVRQWQELFYGRAYSSVAMDGNPDFVRLAEAYGATGLRARRPGELAAVLGRAFATPGVVVVDALVAQEENVFPIVPPGAAASEMVLS